MLTYGIRLYPYIGLRIYIHHIVFYSIKILLPNVYIYIYIYILFYLKHLFLIYTLVAYGYQIDIAWLNLI